MSYRLISHGNRESLARRPYPVKTNATLLQQKANSLSFSGSSRDDPRLRLGCQRSERAYERTRGLRGAPSRGILGTMKVKSAVQRDGEFRELLTSRGLRVTEQRVELLQELVRVTSPISHPELNERMAKSGLDRATIYRNLLTLAEAGVIVRAQLGDQVWRYELPRTTTSDHAHHPHLVCSECGNVRCLAAGTVKLHGEAAKSQVAEVQLRGRCADCVNA